MSGMKTSAARRSAAARITVQKKNPAGEVTYQYEGVMLSRDEHSIVLEALFDRADMPFMDVVFKTGDRFVEYYYADRWYNIFEIHDRDDGKIKGWYCNIGKPAVFEDGTVSYIDLALDLWVSADGEQSVLDEDEFEELKLSEELRTGAQRGLDELKSLFKSNSPPL
jgi:protein associated with RNAse G/E